MELQLGLFEGGVQGCFSRVDEPENMCLSGLQYFNGVSISPGFLDSFAALVEGGIQGSLRFGLRPSVEMTCVL
jgi:hypothetical protein